MAQRTNQDRTITGVILGIGADRTVTLPCQTWRMVAQSFDDVTAELIAAFCNGRDAAEQVSITCDAGSTATVDRALSDGRHK